MKKEEALSSPLSKGVESRLDSRPLVIGDYTLSSLVVQEFYLDGGAMFGVVPKTLWEKVVPADSMNRIKLLARLLLISGNGRHILVDTGMGSAWSEKLSAIYALSPFTLSIELQRFGLQMHDITDVIYTHLHYDHLAGAFELQDGHLQPLFPDAMHHVQEENYRYASHPHPKEKAGYLGRFVEAFGRQKNLNLLNGDTELFKGIRLSISNGHTKGQQLVTVFDDHLTLVHCADLIPFAAHIPLAWVMSYDIEPLTVFDEKTDLLELAVKESWILFFGHDPNHEAATVRRDEKGIVADRYIAFRHADSPS